MSPDLHTVCQKLDELAAAISKQGRNDEYMSITFGGSIPPLNGRQLHFIPVRIAKHIKDTYTNVSFDEEPHPKEVEEITETLSLLLAKDFASDLFSGNVRESIPSFMVTMWYIKSVFDRQERWEDWADKGLMTKEVADQIRSIKFDLKEFAPKKGELQEVLRNIKSVTTAVDDLHTSIDVVEEAGSTVAAISKQASELFGQIKDYPEKIKKLQEDLEKKEQEIADIVKKSYEAYRMTTSIGLAGAFDERAKRSEWAMWGWVIALAIALGLGAWAGSVRIHELTEVLNRTDPNWGVITIHLVITLFSFSGPIWFAWLATKQIGQRFRLAEDYAYKASIAKSYEGFRSEAVRIDPEFEARLFGSTLTRLDEAPMRLFDSEPHGSPWHELFSSKAFQDLLKTAPGAKDELLQLIREKLPSFGNAEKISKSSNDAGDFTSL